MNPNQRTSFNSGETRRGFIKKTAAVTALAAGGPWLSGAAGAEDAKRRIDIFADENDPLVKEAPVQWAIGYLRACLERRSISTTVLTKLDRIEPGQMVIVVSDQKLTKAKALAPNFVASIESAWSAMGAPESLGLANGFDLILAGGADARGLMYALLELSDRVNLAGNVFTELKWLEKVTVERPANRIRSVARCFVSDVEDKEWFNDRAFWTEYLTMLAAQRFNRFSLTLGIGYDFTADIRDCYFHFAYPFLVSVPGHDVKAKPLPDSERDSNLEMLRFISEEAARRGLHFQLGLWTHAYQWTNSPRANYIIEGLTQATHGPYCRDALTAVLKACPAIKGVTLRIHGESGVAEGSYDFWKMVFDGVVRSGRRVEIDMHAKGMDQATIDGALATGLPVTISPKYWAEHLGLPYMQAAIRPQEMPPKETRDTGFFSKSNGSRRFLRYGYGDLLAEDRKYGVVHRIWPGTQRLLLWGDPAMAAAYGRNFSFCGSDGFEWLEPLSFKGRKGSGLAGGRGAYADASLRTPGGGWEKYLYTYRLWGRLTYNPDAKPETWQRLLKKQFGAGADKVEEALANASRILPLITTAHLPSAANNSYWPEIYTNMSIADARKANPYPDTLSPKRFGAVSPLDPEMFSRIDDYAAELLQGKRMGKISPRMVANWLEDLAEKAAEALATATTRVDDAKALEFRRIAVDIAIQSGLGKFFGEKLRAGIYYALFEQSGHRPALEESVKAYRSARTAWAELSEKAKEVYSNDITFGYEKQLRGCWADRLPAIDEDIADLEKRLAGVDQAQTATGKFDAKIIEQAMKGAVPHYTDCTQANLKHEAPSGFQRGKDVNIETRFISEHPGSVLLYYRHVDQAEEWRTVMMDFRDGHYSATIPAQYTDSPFPLQYFFEVPQTTLPYFEAQEIPSRFTLRTPRGDVYSWWQPYFVIRQAKG